MWPNHVSRCRNPLRHLPNSADEGHYVRRLTPDRVDLCRSSTGSKRLGPETHILGTRKQRRKRAPKSEPRVTSLFPLGFIDQLACTACSAVPAFPRMLPALVL